MKIHHIGYLVDNIEVAASTFENLGFSKTSEIVEDTLREIYILFMDNSGYVIELIQPVNESSPVYKLRKKHRNSPYHICYETDDLQIETEKMVNSGQFVFLHPPQAASAIDNKLVAFLVSNEIGLIEIINM